MLKAALFVLCSLALLSNLYGQTKEESDFKKFIQKLDFENAKDKVGLELNSEFLNDYELIWTTACPYTEVYSHPFKNLQSQANSPCFSDPKFKPDPKRLFLGNPKSNPEQLFYILNDSTHLVTTKALIIQHGGQISTGVKHSYFYRRKKD